MIDSLLEDVSSFCTDVNFSLLPWISWGSSKSSDRVYGNRVVFLSMASKVASVVALVSSQSPDRISASERVRPGLAIGLVGAVILGHLSLDRGCVLLIFDCTWTAKIAQIKI